MAYSPYHGRPLPEVDDIFENPCVPNGIFSFENQAESLIAVIEDTKMPNLTLPTGKVKPLTLPPVSFQLI